MTVNLFVPPAADGLPLAALDSATEGADRLDAAALTPTGRNFLAHALVQLARDGWLRPDAGEGFEPTRDPETAMPAAVSVPPPTRADGELRDRIRRAICEAEGFAWDPGMLEPDEYGEVADAVLAVLPPPADRAAVLREAAEAVANHPGPHQDELQPSAPGFWWDSRDRDAAADLLRRMADEAQRQPDTERPRCPHCQLPHDLTPSVALACASIRASIADRDAAVGSGRVAAEEPAAETQADADLPDRLKAVLTERFTDLGNPFSEMRRHEQGPDGWPATHPVGAAKVAEVLRELMASPPTERPVAGEQPDTQETRVVAYVPAARTELHCLRCAPNPAGNIWTPVTSEELEDGGICTVCGVDVLIPQERPS